jgi:protein tyrosine phosphatase
MLKSLMNPFQRFKYHFSHNRPAVHMHLDELTMLDYNYIDEGIFVGTNQCCTVGLGDVLGRESITADVSLEKDRLDAPFGVSSYTWIPTPDHNIPTKEQLFFGIATLENLVKAKQKIYLHCKNGHGRSSTFLSAYLIKTRGLSFEEAFEVIKSKRKSASMHESQVTFIKNLEKELRSA